MDQFGPLWTLLPIPSNHRSNSRLINPDPTFGHEKVDGLNDSGKDWGGGGGGVGVGIGVGCGCGMILTILIMVPCCCCPNPSLIWSRCCMLASGGVNEVGWGWGLGSGWGWGCGEDWFVDKGLLMWSF